MNIQRKKYTTVNPTGISVTILRSTSLSIRTFLLANAIVEIRTTVHKAMSTKKAHIHNLSKFIMSEVVAENIYKMYMDKCSTLVLYLSKNSHYSLIMDKVHLFSKTKSIHTTLVGNRYLAAFFKKYI